jgi:uncharacterized membrane protein
MGMDTFTVFAASYDTLGAAEADYHAVQDFYLESGALVALFPAVGIGAGLLVGAAGGAGLGALAGHVTAGLSRADLKDLGELLDQGHSGLVVVAASDLEARIEQIVRHADRLTKKQLKADQKVLEREIDQAAASAG